MRSDDFQRVGPDNLPLANGSYIAKGIAALAAIGGVQHQ